MAKKKEAEHHCCEKMCAMTCCPCHLDIKKLKPLVRSPKFICKHVAGWRPTRNTFAIRYLSADVSADERVKAEDVCDRPEASLAWSGRADCCPLRRRGTSFERCGPSARIWEADWSCTRL